MTALLDVQGLTKRFPVKEQGKFWLGRGRSEVYAVDDVSFAIGMNETVGLVGESGSGKSTLVRLVARLLDPTSGMLAFEGVDIGSLPARRFARSAMRPKIQMVLQDPTDSLNPSYTAFDAIADPLRRLAPLKKHDLAARVSELATLCGLGENLLFRYPHQLSGGQKARVGIARALALNPRLLILDEPTSALDVSVQVVILHLLQDLKERLGLSYLFVSHDLNVVRLMCSRVLVMYSGKIVESGATSTVFQNPAHPYTAALLSAIPGRQEDGRRDRIHLSGEPVSPINPDPNVCRFHTRCFKGAPLCVEQAPALVRLEDDRFAACHFPLIEPRAAAAAGSARQ